MAANIKQEQLLVSWIYSHIPRKLQVWPSAVGGREQMLVSSSESGLVVLIGRHLLLWLVWRVGDHPVPRGLLVMQLRALDLLLELLHVVLHEGAYRDPCEKMYYIYTPNTYDCSEQ